MWDYLNASLTYEYRYDENWQLTKCTETLQNGITTEYDYQYDKDGNRSKYVKTVNGEWTECYTYEYNSANQLVKRTNERLWTDNVTYYTYDADGNLITEQTGHHKTTYEYTAENRLAVVKEQGTVLMAALYDGDGNRLFTMDYTGENNDRWDIWIPECGGNADQVDDSAKDAMRDLASLVSRKDRKDYTITEYVNDVTRENEEVLAELNHRGKVTTAYTYGYTRESADVYGDTQYYLYDGQGNVSRISSEWGRVKETYSYDPYGNLTYGVPDTVNYYGYNGESSNLATGLQYLRARYYNPQNGNFITEDTYAGQISNPLTLNRYDYVSNNPVNYIDPSGHYSWKQFKKDAGNVWNSFVDKWNTHQQNQQYEYQLVAELVTGNLDNPTKENSKNSNTSDKTTSEDIKKTAGDNGKNTSTETPKQEKTDVYTTYRTQTEEIEQRVLAEKTKILCSDEAINVYAGVAATLATIFFAPYFATLLTSEFVVSTTAGVLFVKAGSAGFTYGATYTGLKSIIEGEDLAESMASAYEDGLLASIVAVMEAGFGYVITGMPVTNTPGKTDVFPESVKGGSDTTKLYRVMSDAEYESLMSNGEFTPYDMAMEEKWFATSVADAEEWASHFYPDGNYRMVEIEVNTSSLSDMYYNEYLDGIGPAYCSPLDVINEAIQSIKGVK